VADGLTAEEKAAARLIFEGKAESGQRACLHCGGIHLRACRRVKIIEWHTDGSVLKAEYWPDGQWDEHDITWPEEAYEDEPVDEEAADGSEPVR
jgi:hypothetical protein